MGSGKHNVLRISIGVLGSLVILGGAGGAIYYLTTKTKDTQEYTVKFDGLKEGENQVFVPKADVKFKLNEEFSFKWAKNSAVDGAYKLNDGASKVIIGTDDRYISQFNTYDDDTHTSGTITIPYYLVTSPRIAFQFAAFFNIADEPTVTGEFQDEFGEFSPISFVEKQPFSVPYYFVDAGYEIDPTSSLFDNGTANGSQTFQKWSEDTRGAFNWENGKVKVPGEIVTSTAKFTFAARYSNNEVIINNYDKSIFADVNADLYQIGQQVKIYYTFTDTADSVLDQDNTMITATGKEGPKTQSITKWNEDETYITVEYDDRIQKWVITLNPNIVQAANVEIAIKSKRIERQAQIVTTKQMITPVNPISYVKGNPIEFKFGFTEAAAGWFKYDGDSYDQSFINKNSGPNITFEAAKVDVVGDDVSGYTVTIPAETTADADDMSINLAQSVIYKQIIPGEASGEHIHVGTKQTFSYENDVVINYTIDKKHMVDEANCKVVFNDAEGSHEVAVKDIEGATFDPVKKTFSIPWTTIVKTYPHVFSITTEFATLPEPIPVANVTSVNFTEKSCTLTLMNEGTANANVQYSTDLQIWNPLESGKSVTIDTDKQVFYLRGSNPNGLATSLTNYAHIVFNNSVTLSGSIMGLINNGEEPLTTIPSDYCFAGLFKGNTKTIDLSASFLNATTLKKYCYANMFNGCTGLTKAPNLPVTELTEGCYYGMFEGTGLTALPDLKATTLVPFCYANMFKNCKSIQQGIDMSSITKLDGAVSCCESMYEGSGLISAPRLAAPGVLLTDAKNCYKAMFKDCENMKVSEAALTSAPADYCFCPDYDGYDGTHLMSYYAGDMFTGTSGTFAGTPTYYNADYDHDHFYYNQIDLENRDLDYAFDISSFATNTNYAFGSSEDVPFNVTNTYHVTIDWDLVTEYHEEWATNIEDEYDGWCIAVTSINGSGWLYNYIKEGSVKISIDRGGGVIQEVPDTDFGISPSYHGIIPTKAGGWGLTTGCKIIVSFQLSYIDTWESEGYICIFAESWV